MHRRQASAWVATMLLAGCGGGGGGGGDAAASFTSASGAAAPPPPAPEPAPAAAATPAPAPAPAPAAPANFSGPPHVAIWGDSLAVSLGLELGNVFSDRQVFNAGIAGETSAQISARHAADNRHRDWINIFWYGHNDVLNEPATAAEKIKRELAASIARLTPGNNRFVVLSVVNNAETPRGSERYNIIMQLNRELAALYPNNFVDIRSHMVNQFDPNNAQQRAEFEQDIPSSSLRFDWIHLTYYGADLLAKWTKQLLLARGW